MFTVIFSHNELKFETIEEMRRFIDGFVEHFASNRTSDLVLIVNKLCDEGVEETYTLKNGAKLSLIIKKE